MSDDCSRILDFYSGAGVDHRGRTFAEVLRFPVRAMEETHDYIQWLFPLNEPSSVASNAPVIDERCAHAFQGDTALRHGLLAALDKMLGFYGMKMSPDAGGDNIVRTSYFAKRAPHWLTPGNHNFMRLTRIMKSLTLLGQAELARALAGCLEGVYAEYSNVVGQNTLEQWRRATPGSSSDTNART